MIGLGLSLTEVAARGGGGIPSGAIRQRDGSAIQDRAGSYIEVR